MGKVTTFGVVTGPISRLIEALFAIYNWHKNGDNFCHYIEPLFAIYNWHGNGDNFWCRDGARQSLYPKLSRALQPPGERRQVVVSKRGPSAVRSKLSSQSTTCTGKVTYFIVETGPIISQIEALFVLYNRDGNGDNF
ncbi:hypothetical protein L484_001503 [Morus notabilis]|uniref:Uncharacterized protein n=1 Tax=Morus notabilis TaxID=981085 RepID=W9SI10_9ROSA|nr:hypothetical protein L484_001503 [Morus notabilis]